MRKRQLNFFQSAFGVRLAITVAFIMGATSASASSSKLDVMAGVYSISATTDKASGSLSGFGAYRFTYRYRLLQNLDVYAGYSLIMSQVISGDMGYGPDFGVSYFPLTAGGPADVQIRNVSVSSTEIWRPYFGGSFHQRQFQSVNSAYAGFGASVGTDYHYSAAIDFKAEVRVQVLTGPNKAAANATEVLFGVSVTPQ